MSNLTQRINNSNVNSVRRQIQKKQGNSPSFSTMADAKSVVTDFDTFQSLIGQGSLSDFELSKHTTAWECETLGPVVNGLSTWANLAAFPQDKRNNILADMEKNCEPFADANGYAFPHSAMLGCAKK